MSRLSRVEFSTQFQKHFKIHLRPEWLDTLLMSVERSMKVRINVITFDKYLHEQFGNYENEGKSMATDIKEHFGASASKLIYDHL